MVKSHKFTNLLANFLLYYLVRHSNPKSNFTTTVFPQFITRSKFNTTSHTPDSFRLINLMKHDWSNHFLTVYMENQKENLSCCNTEIEMSSILEPITIYQKNMANQILLRSQLYYIWWTTNNRTLLTWVPRCTGWLTRYMPGDVYTEGTHTKHPQQI